MSEKEKAKYDGSRFGMLRSCLIFSFFPLLIVTSFGMVSLYWAIGGYVKPSLDAQYIPTAEYLLEHPIEMPLFSLEVRAYLYPPMQSEYSLRVDIEQNSPEHLCFYAQSSYIEDFDYLRWAEIYINEQVLGRFHPNWADADISGIARLCVSGHLDSGLHIIEFRAKENAFAEPYYIHRWAIEIP